ncbi:MAG: hypothetical protein Q4F43_01045 [Eubacteriales bacterium]|nr:hypothetical protein [Eubacteriales bacterium]
MSEANCPSSSVPAEEDGLVRARERFDAARARIITWKPRERHGIGMQSEKTLHAVLKYYADPEEDHHEIPIDRFIADVYHDDRIIEIQTAHLDAMRQRLQCFLDQYPVRIVHPIPARKWIIWIDPETGELVKRNRSSRRGSFYQAFRELYRIRPWLRHPNLTLELLLIDMDEYRLLDGWSRDRKRGSHRYDRIPLALQDRLLLTCPRDYMQLVPADLQEPFTSAQFAAAAGYRKNGFSTVLLLLTEMGVLDRVGKKGNSWLYKVTQEW